MPILKIPVRHSFGIVARGAHDEIATERRNDEQESQGRFSRPVFEEEALPEVNKAFVDAFNNCDDIDRAAFISLAEKILFRLKRLAGVSKSRRLRTNISKAWFELTLLSDCEGSIADIAYDLLVCSLEKTPLDGADISVLLHVGELSLVKVKQSALVGAAEEQCEKLMTVLELTFQRLLYYQRVGSLSMCAPHLDQYIKRFDAIGGCSSKDWANPGSQYAIYFVTEVLKSMRAGMLSKNWLIECLKLLRDVEWERLSESAIDRLLMVLPGKLGGDGTWLDSVVLFKVLSHGAEAHVSVLRLLQCIVTRTMTACPWELLYKYTQLLAHVALHGKTSAIKKMALEGCSTFKLGNFEFHGTGLLALRYYHEGYNEDSHWKVRFGVVDSLAMLWQCGEGGIKTVAYTSLDEMRERERDHRVLSAVRFGNVHAAFDRLLTSESSPNDTIPSSLNGKMMMGLALHYMTEEDNPFGKLLAPLRNMKAASARPKRNGKAPSTRQRQPLDNRLLPELNRNKLDYKTRCALELQHMFDAAFEHKQRDQEEGMTRTLPALPPSPFNEPTRGPRSSKSRGKSRADCGIMPGATIGDKIQKDCAQDAGAANDDGGDDADDGYDFDGDEDGDDGSEAGLVRSPSWVIDEVERMEKEVREFESQIRSERDKHIAKLVSAVSIADAKKARRAKSGPRVPNHSKGSLLGAVSAFTAAT